MSKGKIKGVYFTLQLYEKIRKLATRENRSFSQMVRILLEKGLKY